MKYETPELLGVGNVEGVVQNTMSGNAADNMNDPPQSWFQSSVLDVD